MGPPALGVLRPGDHVLRLDSVDIARPGVRDSLRTHGLPREAFPITLERDGHMMTVVLPPVQLSAWQRLRLQIYPLIAIIAAPLVAFLLIWRRPDLATSWAFLGFAIMQGLNAIWILYQFPQSDPGPVQRLYLVVYAWMTWMYPASVVALVSMFPRPRWRPGTWLTSVWGALVCAAVLACLVPWMLERGWVAPPPEWLRHRVQAVVILVGVIGLVGHYLGTRPGWTPSVGQRVLACIAGFALVAGVAIHLLATEPRLQALVSPIVVRVAAPGVILAWLSTPLILAYLIADDPRFDPRRLVVSGVPYAVLSGVLAALYLALVLAGERVFASATGERTLVVQVVAALTLAFVFAPARERVQRAIARLFGRDPATLRRALDRTGRDLLSALDAGEVRAAVERGLAEGMRRPAAVEWPPSAAPRLREPERVHEDIRGPIEALLAQAGVRLENLRLAAERAAAERSAVELQEAATRAELRALQAQVQPHFLFNALNALAYLIESDPSAASRFTERLADMLRYTVEAGRRPAVALSEEVAFLEDYLGVARERYETALHFVIDGDPALLSQAVPPLLLQPLVENSLKHGLAPGRDALHMTLTARRVDGWLELVFADDGRTDGTQRPGLGVGLENLEQRVRRFAGPQARMEAGPGPNGFVVRLRWPVHTGGDA